MKQLGQSIKYRHTPHWFGFAAASVLAVTLAGCGGGSSDPVVAPPAATTVASAIAAASAVGSNDTSTNSSASFTVLQDAGLPSVTVNSPPVVNFTVFSDGAVKTGLTNSNVRFAIAKLVPGVNGEPDQWVNYINVTKAAVPGFGPGGVPKLSSAVQATTDSNADPARLVYNNDGYYTYTFKTDITNIAGVAYEPNLTHRVAIQLSYKNAAGDDVKVNPYFDFTLVNGKSVPVTDPAKTRKMTDVGSCNGCHDKLALHGGGRVDTQYCVMCHNPGTTDPESGENLNLSTMVHKIHAGKYLKAKTGNDYTIWGYNNSKNDYAEVAFPGNVRNCAACHSADTAAKKALTPQGDNWKTTPSKGACLTCHQSDAGSPWANIHLTTLKLGATAQAVSNTTCAGCHADGKAQSTEKAHWLQELANTALYENKIESATLTTKPTATTNGVLTVKYAVVNPATGVAYDLREGCASSTTQKDDGGTLIGKICNTNYRWNVTGGAPQDKFGTIGFTLATNTFTQTTDDTTNTTSGTGYLGVDDGTHHYTLKLSVPKGAHGNARIVMLGSVAETRLDPLTRAQSGVVPPVGFSDMALVPVKNGIYEFDLDTGKKSTKPRREIVSNEKCNVCHGYLGIPIDPTAGATIFHSGVRNNSESCEACHNWARAGGYTAMADGSSFNESWNAKRMIHGIHSGGSVKRTYPFTHGNNFVGAFGKNGLLLADGVTPLQSSGGAQVLNFSAEVAYPQDMNNCNACHVNDSWKQNKAVLGSALVSNSTGMNAAKTLYTNPGINLFVASGACVGQTGSVAGLDLKCTSTDFLKLPVVSPKAAVCTACHDSLGVQAHVTSTGGATFGTLTQGDLFAGKVLETCDGCHAPGSNVAPIDVKHILK